MPAFFDKPHEKGYIKSFDGLKIYWEHHGAAFSKQRTPILFCYGLACSKHQWRSLAEMFVNEHPLIFFDYRGHHRSEYQKENEKIRINQLAKDACKVLEELSIKEAHVFGHSMGCNVALELAFNFPEKTKSLVLIAGSAENPFKRILGLKFLDSIMPTLLGTFPEKKEQFRTFWSWVLKNRPLLKLLVLATGFNRKAVEGQDIETYLDSVANVSPNAFFELLHDMSLGNSESLLRRIESPTLVVSGANDQVTPPDVQKKLAQSMPNAEYFSIPLGSHNVQLEFADYLNRKIREFWSQRISKPTIKKVREKKSERN